MHVDLIEGDSVALSNEIACANLAVYLQKVSVQVTPVELLEQEWGEKKNVFRRLSKR